MMAAEFQYVPYEDPLLKDVREHRMTESLGKQLPPGKIACVDCPNAGWMWVVKTDAGRKRAMAGFEDKADWRCECHARSGKATYDGFASTVDPECWVIACTDRVKAIEEHRKEQELAWLLAQKAADEAE